MTKKKWLVLLIIAFHSFFWLILETSTINSRRLPIYGPKKAIAPGDTEYYQVSDRFFALDTTGATSHQIKEPLYAIVFINHQYRQDSYRLPGLWEYLNYKTSKVEHIPFALVTESENGHSPAGEELKKLDSYANVSFYTWPRQSFDSLTKAYFKEKPYYIDYSFFLLVDANRRIRGYYDGRYVSEFKRLIEEYQHLRLKDEKQKLIETNEIKSPA